MTIGVSMIVKNEEVMILDCLESVKDFDEIVILDTGSTDKTAEKVKSFKHPNLKYIAGEYKWNDDFAEARNKAKSYNKSDWLFQIDADEIYTGAKPKKLKLDLDNSDNVSFDRVIAILTSNGQSHPYPRLFRNSPDVHYSGACHEKLLGKKEVKNITRSVTIDYRSSPAHLQDPGRSMRILKKVVSSNPNDVRSLYYLAREYYYEQNYFFAIQFFRSLLENPKTQWNYRVDALMLKAYCHSGLGELEAAQKCCMSAIALNPNFKEAYSFMATTSPKFKDVWLNNMKNANNKGVLFARIK